VSKNVAVFVDVANIFYAAKAAGVDIDYVTLLKAAIAGRDFVRAYAYTGLDPENENQRQFHSFLARSGYKVVSKDVRKYGDGKIKANLDIELVVDLMRTARNLDVAVVVSGDGDFAPAIRSVQQQGVRVEVISFRGNTSSDLIEVADVFTDITQIARVEKGSRSGRRVAAEDDLSMTEVPDKETEGAPRRRRTRTRTERGATREPVAAAAATGPGGQLIVLPGEKLSRAASNGEGALGEDGSEGEDQAEEAAPGLARPAGEGEEEAGRRRRRRRGGRGRGRGRGADREAAPLEDRVPEEDEEVGYEPPRLPQASTFGSVWDSQLGVAPTPAVPTGEVVDEPYEDEPEIPEYLLAERRQRGQRGAPPRGGRGRSAAYQSAVERERFGRSGAGPGRPGPGPGRTGGGPGRGPGSFAGPRREPGRRDDRGRGRGRPPQRAPVDRFLTSPAPGGDPWSEVPPELEEMLRAQLGTRPRRDAEAGTSTIQPLPVPEAEEPASAVAPATTGTESEAPASAPKRRAATKRAATTTRSRSKAASATEESETPPKRRTTARASTGSRRTSKTAAAADEAETSEGGQTGEGNGSSPARTRRRTTRRTSAESGSPPEASPESGEA
jgi:uncharacterized LabA/DUF88 family protein